MVNSEYKVKERWKSATIFYDSGWYIVSIGGLLDYTKIAKGRTEQAAWNNSAKVIKKEQQYGN